MDTEREFQSLTNDNETPRDNPKRLKTTREDFTGTQIAVQFKLPEDLMASLRLHAIQANKTMSELVFDALTSRNMIHKAWISTRGKSNAA